MTFSWACLGWWVPWGVTKMSEQIRVCPEQGNPGQVWSLFHGADQNPAQTYTQRSEGQRTLWHGLGQGLMRPGKGGGGSPALSLKSKVARGNAEEWFFCFLATLVPSASVPVVGSESVHRRSSGLSPGSALGDHSWQLLGGPYGVPRIEPRLGLCLSGGYVGLR